ncbi:MAG: crotonase/enoyl-CoA hydratase family protein [Gammaproteobacteria bacterium]
MHYEQIAYAVEDGVLTLTLNRPDKLNAFTHTMLRELIDAFDRADADDEVRVIIVTGAGRGFCAGADLSAGAGSFNHAAERDAASHRDGGGLLTLRIYESRKPVIAAINGAAVGVGATMTLPMDIRLASSDARFGFVFARRGIVPEACSSWFLPRVVGISQALEWAYSGRVFPAQEALAGGLVKEVLAPEDLLPRARAIAAEIVTQTSAISVTLIRHMMWRMLSADHPMDAHRIDSRGVYALGQTADAKEGVSSFLEKRAPKFRGKVSRDLPDFFPWWEESKF